VTVRWNEACLHAAVYDFTDAAAIGAEAIEAGSEALDLGTVLGWRRDQANWTGSSGRPSVAAKCFRELLGVVQVRLGPDDWLTLACRSDLARWLGKEGQVGDAVAQFQALLADIQRMLGPDHPDTLTPRANRLGQEERRPGPAGGTLIGTARCWARPSKKPQEESVP